MKSRTFLGTALLAGTLFAAVALPASAQQRGHDNNHRSGNHNGYVNQNHRGYTSGHRGHDNRNHGNRGQDNRGHPSNRGHDNRSWGHNNYNRNGYSNRNHHSNRYGNSSFSFSYNTYGPNYGSYRSYRPNYGSYGHNNYNNYRPRYQWNPYQRVIYAQHFRNQHHRPRYAVGHRFNNHHNYRINDYRRYGLYAPPSGYYWTRYDGDAYLAAAGTGLVAGIIIGALID